MKNYKLILFFMLMINISYAQEEAPAEETNVFQKSENSQLNEKVLKTNDTNPPPGEDDAAIDQNIYFLALAGGLLVGYFKYKRKYILN